MRGETSLLERRIFELEEINTLAQSLVSTLNVDSILASIVESCIKLCQAERVAILLISPSKDITQTLVRSAKPSVGAIDQTINVFIAGWIEHHKEPLLTDDITRELDIKSSTGQLGDLGPVLAVPLLSAGKIIGIINLVNSRNGRRFSEDELRVAKIIAGLAAQFIERAKLQQTLFQDNLRLKTALRQRYDVSSIIGRSSLLHEAVGKIPIVAASQATVLLTGETGTGKELFAQAIHYQSDRAEKPFIPVNCAAIPTTLFESELFGHERGAFTGAAGVQKGKFELANTGTIFLDEISEMPLELQPKLLRVLEERSFFPVGSSVEKHVDVRVIAASSKQLTKATQDGKFREDLFHRLNVLPLHLPPLRERPEDIPLLAQTFLDEFSSGTKRFRPDAIDLLSKHQWPGNVRELRNVVERVSIFLPSREISGYDLRTLGIETSAGQTAGLTSNLLELMRSSEEGTDVFESLEHKLVELALRETGGNITKASQLLGIDRNALQRRIEKYRITAR